MLIRRMGLAHYSPAATPLPPGSGWRPDRWLVAVVGTSSAMLIAALALLPYWLDEVTSNVFALRPLSEVITYAATDIHPPLYFVLLHFWMQLAGADPVATALLSVAFFGGAAFFLYRLAVVLFDRATARISLLLLLTNFFISYHATETRMFTLMLAAALGSTLAVAELVVHADGRRWWLWLGCSIVGVYTHYFYWLVVVAQNLAVVVLTRRQPAGMAWGRWWKLHAILFISYLPWLPVMVSRLNGKSSQLTWMRNVPLGQRLGSTAADALLPFNPIVNIIPLPSHWAWAILAAVAGLVFVRRVRLRRHAIGVQYRPLTTPVLLLGIVAVTPVIIGNAVGAWFPRYFILSVALLVIAWARWLVTAVPVSARRYVVAAWLLAVSGANWWTYLSTFQHDIAFQWPRVARYLARAADRDGGTVFLAAAEERLQLAHYYRGALPVRSFLPRQYDRGSPELDRLRIAGLPAATLSNVRDAGDDLTPFTSVWYVRGPSVKLIDPQGLIESWIASHCQRGSRQRIFGSNSTAWQEIVVVHFQACAWSWPQEAAPAGYVSG